MEGRGGLITGDANAQKGLFKMVSPLREHQCSKRAVVLKVFPPRVTVVVQCRTPSGSGVARSAMIGLDG